ARPFWPSAVPISFMPATHPIHVRIRGSATKITPRFLTASARRRPLRVGERRPYWPLCAANRNADGLRLWRLYTIRRRRHRTLEGYCGALQHKTIGRLSYRDAVTGDDPLARGDNKI